MKKSPTAFLTLLLAGALLLSSAPQVHAKGFKTTVTASDIQEAYEDAKSGNDDFRILIVPGHEPNYGGAVFQGVYEREIVVEIANKLAADLRTDKNIEVIVARSNTSWNKTIDKYFDKQMKKITSFVSKQKKEMAKKVKQKKVKLVAAGTQVDHATAPTDVALRLYGLNKWANENDIDLVVNVHVNDATDHGPNQPGANSGFAIYIPDKQYGNGPASRPVAAAIARELSAFTATSTLRIENQGVVEDQELIAIGSNNSLKVPTVLVEYGYITEERMLRPEVRDVLTSDFAYQTYRGLVRFLGETPSGTYATEALPYTWTYAPSLGSTGKDVYALQVALKILGFYPPTESTLVECSISGIMNECTQVALMAYQKSLGIQEDGALGPKTRAALNAKFSK